MQALDLLLPQPCFDLAPDTRRAFESLIDSTPPGGLIDYGLDHPRWQFLSWICRSRDWVLHGSPTPGIQEVQPRKANDIRAFSDQQMIYATTDGIWAVFFAILDRRKFPRLTMFNSCLEVHLPPHQIMGPLYFFSITHSILLQKPWCTGTVYVLPRGGFQREPAQHFQGVEILFPHWISSIPVRPAARLAVGPEDFPFLAQIHGHDDESLARCAAADPDGFPWPSALVT